MDRLIVVENQDLTELFLVSLDQTH